MAKKEEDQPMASWNALSNQPSFSADTMLLLTDGTVMCHQEL
jgi:hypothetical protein